MPSPNIDPTVRLFIGGLPYRFTEGELLTLFAPFGRVVSLKIMHTPWGKSRGMGFVEFDNVDSAIKAKQSLHNHRVSEERTIIVDFAAPDPATTEEGRLRREQVQSRKPLRRQFSNVSNTSISPKDPFTRQNRGTNKSDSGRRPYSPKTSEGTDSEKPRKFGNFKRGKSAFGNNRQSVFDSRSHHSRVGAKFANRQKN
ncbi:RNA-binding protein [Candidatus Shapirobacteria bacterium]|nr:RNA-binding protein [Candidatus Shapirobacteria bacterium]